MRIIKRVLQPIVDAAWHAVHGKKNKSSLKKGFEAAQATRLLASWARDGQSMNAQLKMELRPLRARSRDLCNNNDYAKGFITEVKSNVIGAKGVRLQARAKNNDGTLDQQDNNAIELAWKKSGKVGEFEASKRFDRATFERLLIETVARDGEALVRMLPAFKNTSRFAVQFIDADYLDETYSTDDYRPTHNRVRMGVEIDSFGAPVAYHLRKNHPGDRLSTPGDYDRIRVDAKEILHIYLPMYQDQWRGIPWMHSSMIGLRDLGGYREAALIAARVGAAKMGFIVSPTGNAYDGDGQDSDGNTVMNAEAGSFDQVAEGTELLNWDPQYPHGDFEPFNKTILRGISAGWGISYHKASKDLEGVNYSSGRLGELSDRDMWMMLQEWLIGQFHDRLYPHWLVMGLTAGTIKGQSGKPLPMSRLEKFKDVQWQPRRWKWTDPQKEFNGVKGQIDEALTSRSQAIRDMGNDPEEVWREIQQENKTLESMGITPGADGFIQPENEATDDDDEASTSQTTDKN